MADRIRVTSVILDSLPRGERLVSRRWSRTCVLRSYRNARASGIAQRAEVRHGDSNSIPGVARVGSLARKTVIRSMRWLGGSQQVTQIGLRRPVDVTAGDRRSCVARVGGPNVGRTDARKELGVSAGAHSRFALPALV